jgi:hypothetical protein
VLYSPDRWTLNMQGDCNLVTYHNGVLHMYAGQIGSPTSEFWHN